MMALARAPICSSAGVSFEGSRASEVANNPRILHRQGPSAERPSPVDGTHNAIRPVAGLRRDRRGR